MASKSTECYLNLLYTMEDVAVYGYMTPLKVKIIIALALTDSVVRDADVLTVCVLPSLFPQPHEFPLFDIPIRAGIRCAHAHGGFRRSSVLCIPRTARQSRTRSSS